MASSSSSSYVPLGFDEDDDEYANMDYEQEGESSGIGVGGRFRRDGCIFIPPDGIKGMGSPIFIIVNEAGELIDQMPLSKVRNFTNSQEKIGKFIDLHTPRRIVINTSGGELCHKMKIRMEELVQQRNQSYYEKAFSEYNSNYVMGGGSSGDYVETMKVYFIDDVFTTMYVRSAKGSVMYSRYGTDARRESLKLALCLGRHLQSPLSAICGLWCDRDSSTPGGPLLSVPLHPMQTYVSNESLIKKYERILIMATAAVGVDMNRAIQHEHMSAMLPFVPGLGVRKAEALLASVRQAIAGLDPNQQYFFQREDLRDPGFKGTRILLFFLPLQSNAVVLVFRIS